MNKPIYSILEISRSLMYKFWYDHIKPKYQNKSKLNIILLLILRLKMFMKALHMMFKKKI